MKNNLSKIMLLAAFLLLFGCAAANYAQIKTGGYRKIPATDAGAVAAAEFAVDAQSEKDESEISLDSIVRAERQTVAGTNYKLCLQVFAKSPDEELEERFVQVVVFKSLKNEYSLKSWDEIDDCGE